MKETHSLVEGPIFWDCNGNLREPIWSCMTGELRCQYLSLHEGHHFYCAAQPIEGQTYPVSGSGKQLAEARPDSGCPWAKTIRKYEERDQYEKRD